MGKTIFYCISLWSLNCLIPYLHLSIHCFCTSLWFVLGGDNVFLKNHLVLCSCRHTVWLVKGPFWLSLVKGIILTYLYEILLTTCIPSWPHWVYFFVFHFQSGSNRTAYILLSISENNILGCCPLDCLNYPLLLGISPRIEISFNISGTRPVQILIIWGIISQITYSCCLQWLCPLLQSENIERNDFFYNNCETTQNTFVKDLKSI